MLLLAVGMASGTLGALAMTRTLASFLYGVRPTDPVTFVAVVVILAGVAFLRATSLRAVPLASIP
jgi:hypothetical protein